MMKHSIVLRREGIKGFLSDQKSIGTDAFNALQSIPGVSNPTIVDESDEQVELTYDWVGEEKFWHIDEHLLKFGLGRVDVK